MLVASNMILWDHFPGTFALPVAPLLRTAIPIQRVEAPWVGDLPIGELWVKRDDLTSAAYGGNKVRKLEFLLGDALSQNASAVLTFGAYGSNHALATAVHARSRGLVPHVVLSPQEPGPYAPATLLAHAGLGTVLHLTDGWDGKRAAALAIHEIVERDGTRPYVIPMGGTNAFGALGYVNAALEVAVQIAGERSGVDAGGLTAAPDIVYVAAGTLGTAVGLAVGFAISSPATRIEAIRVTPTELVSQSAARKLAEETIALLRSLDEGVPALAYEDLALTIRGEFFEPGYGVVTPQTEEAVALAADAGLTLETTYTGKAFAAMVSDAHAGRLDGDRVLFWDTYSSAPKPAPGPIEALPPVLREYIAECERMFGSRI